MSAARVEQRRGERANDNKAHQAAHLVPAGYHNRTNLAVLLPTVRLRSAKWTAHRSGKSVITTSRQRQ